MQCLVGLLRPLLWHTIIYSRVFVGMGTLVRDISGTFCWTRPLVWDTCGVFGASRSPIAWDICGMFDLTQAEVLSGSSPAGRGMKLLKLQYRCIYRKPRLQSKNT